MKVFSQEFALSLVLTLGMGLSLLLTPHPTTQTQEELNFRPIHVTQDLWFPLNRDSSLFMMAALHPGRIWDESFYYRSRPLFVTVHSLLAHAMLLPGHFFRESRFVREIGDSNAKDLTLMPKETSGGELFAAWSSGVLLNILFLSLSGVLLWRFLAVRSLALRVSTFILVLGAPFVLKPFFWTPHTQLLNLLLPLVFLYGVALSKRDCFRTWRWEQSFLLGVACLFYGSCLLLVIFHWMSVLRREGFGRTFGTAVLTSIAPIALWYGILLVYTGTASNTEVRVYRQFVWPLDGLREKTFWKFLTTNLWGYLRILLITLKSSSIGYLVTGVLLARALGLRRNRKRKIGEPARVTLCWSTFFFWWLGHYVERLMANVTTPLFTWVVSFGLPGEHRLPKGRAILIDAMWLILAVSYWIFQVQAYGPFI